MTYQWFIEGHPKAQPRHRSTMAGVQYTPSDAEGWRQRVAAAVSADRPPEPHLGPVTMRLHYFMPRPKSHFKANGDIKPRLHDSRHLSKPDLDNLEKAIKDELQQLGFYRNDSQVWCVTKFKKWERPAHPAGLYLTLDLEQ